MKSDVEQRIKTILASFLNSEVTADDIKDSEEPLNETYKINSIDAVELLILVENEFDIEVDDEDLNVGLFKSLSTLSNYVEKKLKNTEA